MQPPHRQARGTSGRLARAHAAHAPTDACSHPPATGLCRWAPPLHPPLLRPRLTALPAYAQGALYGLVLYGTVDLTNTALLTHWPWRVALVDMTWGSLANALLAASQNRLHGAMS